MSIPEALGLVALGIAVSEAYNWRIRGAERRAEARDARSRQHGSVPPPPGKIPCPAYPNPIERRSAMPEPRTIPEPPLPMSAENEGEALPPWFHEDLRTHGTAKARRIGANWEKP